MIGFGQIIGGNYTQLNEYPWMVEILDDTGGHICGGSLIDDNWVVTAGHCGMFSDTMNIPKPIKVRINGYISSSTLPQAEVIFIDSIFVFPGYSFLNDTTYFPDIALLKLETSSTFSPVDRILLASDTLLTETNDSCTALGWGLTKIDTINMTYSSSDTLKEVDIVFIDKNYCASQYYATNNNMYNIDSTYCAGYISGTTPGGAAAGDSGGPLFVLKNNYPLLVGVVSGGEWVITTVEYPGIFTKLFTVNDWIATVMGTPLSVKQINNFSNKKILSIIDVLGRETKFKTNIPLIYIYDDGTVEKRIVIE